MTKIIKTANQTIELSFNEGANCWQSAFTIDNLTIEIEIDFAFHKEKEIDWAHFEKFIEFISANERLQQLAQSGLSVITELGKSFFGVNSSAAKEWKMVFRNALYYDGKVERTEGSESFSFSLIYDYLSNQNGQIDGDAYGLYRVNFENLSIIGASRTQC